MRQLLTSLALLVTLAAQDACAQSMPYNPDANDDGYISSPDLLSFLPLFGSQVGIDSTLTCDYDGTAFEDFMGGLFSGDIILDSVIVQYHVEDIAEIHVPGCPAPSLDSISIERVRKYHDIGVHPHIWGIPTAQMHYARGGGWEDGVYFGWNAPTNLYFIQFQDSELHSLGLEGFLNVNWRSWWEGYLPFTPAPTMTEEGIFISNWTGYFEFATYVDILPFWHYAE